VLGDEVRVTVIAAGFNGGEPTRVVTPAPVVEEEEPADTAEQSPVSPSVAPAVEVDLAAGLGDTPAPLSSRRTIIFEESSDDLDVPDFLK